MITTFEKNKIDRAVGELPDNLSLLHKTESNTVGLVFQNEGQDLNYSEFVSGTAAEVIRETLKRFVLLREALPQASLRIKIDGYAQTEHGEFYDAIFIDELGITDENGNQIATFPLKF